MNKPCKIDLSSVNERMAPDPRIETVRDFIASANYYEIDELDTVLIMDEYAHAFIGLDFNGDKPRAVYSRNLIIDKLAEGMDDEEASEYFDFNVGGAYVGEQTPIFIDTL